MQARRKVQPQIMLKDMVDARARLKTNKSGGGNSLIVNELISALPMTVIFWLMGLFNRRLYGIQCEEVISWMVLVLVFLNKTRRPGAMNELRGISLLDTLSKYYMGCIMCMTKRLTKPRGEWQNINSFAYTDHCSTAHITLILTNLFAKAREWRGTDDVKTDILVLEGDIEAAFDNAKPEFVAEALVDLGVPPVVIAALLEEQANMMVQPIFEDLLIQPNRMNGSIAQGGVHSTVCWNALIGYIVKSLFPKWNKLGLGLEMDDRLLSHVIWSDNVWIIAPDVKQIRRMFGDLTKELSKH